MGSKEIDCSCSLHTLLTHNFRLKNLNEKTHIITVGRPTPELKNLISSTKIKNKISITYFKKDFYDLFPWLAGCEYTSCVFCWPCVLFSFHKTKWNSDGVDKLPDLARECTKHDQTDSHNRAWNEMKEFEGTNIVKVKDEIEVDPLICTDTDLCTNESAEGNAVGWSIDETLSLKNDPEIINNSRKRTSESIELESLDKVVTKLRKMTEPEEENEFNIYCRSLAIQLKKMPLERALLCQQRIQNLMTSERLDCLKLEKVQDHDKSRSTVTFSCSSCKKVHYIDKKNFN